MLRQSHSGAGREINKFVTFADAVLSVSCLFAYHALDETIAHSKYVLLSTFSCSGLTNPLFGNIRKYIKNSLGTI